MKKTLAFLFGVLVQLTTATTFAETWQIDCPGYIGAPKEDRIVRLENFSGFAGGMRLEIFGHDKSWAEYKIRNARFTLGSDTEEIYTVEDRTKLPAKRYCDRGKDGIERLLREVEDYKHLVSTISLLDDDEMVEHRILVIPVIVSASGRTHLLIAFLPSATVSASRKGAPRHAGVAHGNPD